MSTAPNSPAAPISEIDPFSQHIIGQYTGLTAREHAAIALRVPESGNEWLDAMIRTAQRNAWAGQAMQGLLAANPTYGGRTDNRAALAGDAYAHADAMLSGAQIAEGE